MIHAVTRTYVKCKITCYLSKIQIKPSIPYLYLLNLAPLLGKFVVGRLLASKDVHTLFPELMSMLPYVAKGIWHV